VQSTIFSLKRRGLFPQKICDLLHVIQEGFGIRLPIFVYSGADSRRMQVAMIGGKLSACWTLPCD
jgi:hypothetical protein